jgi:hypothetical protein
VATLQAEHRVFRAGGRNFATGGSRTSRDFSVLCLPYCPRAVQCPDLRPLCAIMPSLQ